MFWISKILAFVFFLIVLNAIRSFLSQLLAPASKRSGKQPQRPAKGPRRTISGQMEKDPVCGMYVASDLAVTTRVKGETVHFCSDKCLNIFLSESKTRQVNARRA